MTRSTQRLVAIAIASLLTFGSIQALAHIPAAPPVAQALVALPAIA